MTLGAGQLHYANMLQTEALDVLKTGANVFLTGEPGSGKSYTVRAYIRYLHAHGIAPAVTASTGIAATHIGGMTLHSWSGIGIHTSLSKAQLKDITDRDRVAKRLRATKVLIIDEISMFDGRTLDTVDLVCRTIKDTDLPFGGMQVIFVGDFFQLPPVTKAGEPIPQFAFASRAWQAANPKVCYLSEQHRQEDQVFVELLSAIRRGQVTAKHKQLLGERQIVFMDDDFENITKLFSHNVDVDKLNSQALNQLEDSPRLYPMAAYGAPPLIEQLKRGCLSPEQLVLKQGAKVMFTKNSLDGSYVNGTTGEVDKYAKDTGYPIVRLRSGKYIEAAPTEWKIEAEGKTLATIIQIPLRLAWAMTVHKSQGMSLDAAVIDLSRAFAYGQGYVALSRVRSLQGLHLQGVNERALQIDPQILAEDESFRQQSLANQIWLASLGEDEVLNLHTAFVLACGGNLNGSGFQAKPKKAKVKRYAETLELILGGMNIAQAANERSRTVFTIFEHLEEARTQGVLPLHKLKHLIAGKEADVARIQALLKTKDNDLLKPIFEHFNGNYDYDTIRLARLFLV